MAIVGMWVLLPGAAGLDAYWQNLLHGRDAVTDVPQGRWDTDAYYREGAGTGQAAADRVYCRRGGFVDGAQARSRDEIGFRRCVEESRDFGLGIFAIGILEKIGALHLAALQADV